MREGSLESPGARVRLTVLSQSPDWAVVAKPPGLVVHRNAHLGRAYAAVQRVRDQLGTRVHPIHRLDRAASGCLLFGLHPEAARVLQAGMSHADARKHYVVLVRGAYRHPSPTEVTNPVKDKRGRPKDAHSTVWCLGHSTEPRCSLLLVRAHTGRYHQVRRHVRDLDHPVIGDSRHGDSKVNRHWRDVHGMGRLALHCLSLDLPLPDGRLKASSPLFEDMASVVSKLPFWDEAVRELPELAAPPLPLPEADSDAA